MSVPKTERTTLELLQAAEREQYESRLFDAGKRVIDVLWEPIHHPVKGAGSAKVSHEAWLALRDLKRVLEEQER